MAEPTLTVALIRDVFHGADAPERLRDRLGRARDLGATLACLPELACNPWSPATTEARDDDAEPPNGPRFVMQSDAARDVGIGLIGGAIIADPHAPTPGTRYNTALIFDAGGRLLGSYAKCHLPEEPGFWETSHYEPGRFPAPVISGFAMPIGVQICSDANRPEGTHLLGAAGAGAVLIPRATEQVTYPRWRTVLSASALTSCCYVLSVDRPGPEQGVALGQPSIAVGPDGEVILESEETVALVELRADAIERARARYPGYLPVRSDLYSAAWADLARE